jgi:heat-inducible transcriptional repressor
MNKQPRKPMESRSESRARVRVRSVAGSAEDLGEVAVELSLREREILRDVIVTYVYSGEPVSSRAVSKHAQHGVSAATIRNVMADLEDMGLLRQPHTSAGRVPTEAAYRFYVESLMTIREISDRTKRYIDEQLVSAHDADQMVVVATHLLSELSSQVGVVMTPSVDEVVLRSVDFVPISGKRVLCVLVSEGGFIDNVVIETETEVSRDDLARFSNYVTRSYAGFRLGEIRDRLLTLMAEERRDVDHWLTQTMAFAERAFSGSSEPRVLIEGTPALLGMPELSDLERVRRMLETFADTARLTSLLSRCLESSGGVRVLMGQDSEVTSELDFSLVATTYGSGDSKLGSLGIIGPSRMEYPRIIPLVRYLGETLSRALDPPSDRGAEGSSGAVEDRSDEDSDRRTPAPNSFD